MVAFNSTVKTYRAIHAHHGWEEQAERIRAAWERGDFAGMAAAVSDEMLAAIALAGTAEDVRAQFAERRAGLFDRTLLWPPAFRGLDGVRAVVEAFAD
jgi:alkanesulfonate monooxygenase SsuD/methylene tetrahydromethanopterin reductase-like flavin-dependent oxidoreductase (luciferase family)